MSMGPEGWSALAAWIYCKMGMMKLGPAPSTHFFATRLMPIVLLRWRRALFWQCGVLVSLCRLHPDSEGQCRISVTCTLHDVSLT